VITTSFAVPGGGARHQELPGSARHLLALAATPTLGAASGWTLCYTGLPPVACEVRLLWHSTLCMCDVACVVGEEEGDGVPGGTQHRYGSTGERLAAGQVVAHYHSAVTVVQTYLSACAVACICPAVPQGGALDEALVPAIIRFHLAAQRGGAGDAHTAAKHCWAE
jgi:hypothetical protein